MNIIYLQAVIISTDNQLPFLVSLVWTPAEGLVCLAAAKRGNGNFFWQAAFAAPACENNFIDIL